jgi:hypothetical protein
MKRCCTCKVEKPESEFHSDVSREDGLRPNCKACHCARQTERRQTDPKHKEKLNAWRRANPEKLRRYKRQELCKNLYGITLEQAEAMHKTQDGKCAICGKPGPLLSSDAAVSLAIDHCHSTGKVRAILCRGCNFGLGNFEDDPERMLKAIDFLRKHKAS